MFCFQVLPEIVVDFIKKNIFHFISFQSTGRFKLDIRSLTNFDASTQKSQRFSRSWALFEQSIYFLSYKSTEELSFMTLKSGAKFEGKLTCCLENDMRNLTNFHQSTPKCRNWNFDLILLSKVENLGA